jgi:hypothetical protein
LKFWLVDPSVVLQKLLIETGKFKPSCLEPPESFYRTIDEPQNRTIKKRDCITRGFRLHRRAWEGSGRAEYPTIAPSTIVKNSFCRQSQDPVIHFEQRTWIKSLEARNDEPLFWESGFLIDKGGGLFELVSAQKSGRVEILRGNAQRTDEGTFKLHLVSVAILNDDRMIRSGRRLHFQGKILDYELEMSTTKNITYQKHLAARLTHKDGAH